MPKNNIGIYLIAIMINYDLNCNIFSKFLNDLSTTARLEIALKEERKKKEPII